ncbi:MAG: uracil-DNA glycosylase [Candidatus Yanofskybacteria bacterium]|nr:uracil-DNA glycosylase [Candidatus Yanofskybacteria bacterium]
MDNRTEQLKKIKEEILNLNSSPLYQERVKNNAFPVIGEGSHYAKIMFIGEAPGRNEAKTGRPFCGASGRILDELLVSIGIDRKDVYVTNIVKDRPPANRDPLPEEISAYAPFLDKQIDIIQPQIIATLGRFSMDYIMRKFGLGLSITNISKMHGKVFSAEANYSPIKIVPLYHPAVAVYNSNMKNELKKDFKILKSFK